MSERLCMHGFAVALGAAALLTLSGCGGGLLTSDAKTPDTYMLQPRSRADAPVADANAGAPATASLPLVLVVARPRASASLDTDRIAIVPGVNRFDYYADARWSEAAPQMMQHALVDSLTADGRFAAVLAAPARVPTELLLDVELRRFEAVATGVAGAPVVHVQLQATLVDSRSSARIASFLSEASAPAAANRMSAVVDAFDKASATVIADVVARVRRETPQTPAAAVANGPAAAPPRQ